MVAAQPKATWEGLFPVSPGAEDLSTRNAWDVSDTDDQQSEAVATEQSLDSRGRRRIFVSAPSASSSDDRLRQSLALIEGAGQGSSAFSLGADSSGVAVALEDPTATAPNRLREAAYLATKRTLDFGLSLFALVVLSPILVAVGCLVRLCNRGPMVYAHPRVGENGKQFTCYKFRTMVVDADELKAKMEHLNVHSDSRTFKMQNDPRVTWIGGFLRRSSIDELPQLVNVLLGDMSLVGPRPAIPTEVALYSDNDCTRLAVKPGLTCIWQVSGRSNLAFPEQVRLDQEYVARRSLWLDLRLIALTIPAVLRSDGAY